jgi:zinc protease
MILIASTFSSRQRMLFRRTFVSLCTLCLCGIVSVAVTPVRAQSVAWPSEFPPRPLAARNVNFPTYQMQTLPNGLQVMVVLHHEQPAVSMRLLIRAGSASDPKAKNGLVHLVSSLLDQGTEGPTAKTAEEFNDAVDFIGGAAGAGAGSDLSYLNMVVMKDSFEAGLRMLSDMARHPAFSQGEIDRQRQQLLSSLQVSFDDPGFIANAVFDRLVYGFHPYGLPQTGTPGTIAGLTRDDLTAFHHKHFVPNNAILAIVGDVTAEEAFVAAGRVFGDWERRDAPVDTFAEPPTPTRRVVIVNKPDSVQTEVRVGNLGIQRNHSDYMAVNLAIRILGGEGSNRLHQVLRTARALTYSAQANFDTFKQSGDFEAETNTRTAATGEVLRLIVDEFWRLQRERVNERELADAKAYLTGSFPLTIETPDAIALQILNVMFYGLPIEQLQNFRERVNAVTVDDIQRVARLYLKPDRLSVVLVGNAPAFTDQLKGIGFGSFETVDIGNLDLTAVDFKRANPPAAGAGGAGEAGGQARLAVPQAVGLARYQPSTQQSSVDDGAKALLDRVIAATGGIEKLRAIRNMTARQTVTNIGPNGPVEAETTSYIAYPDRFRVETKVPEATLVSGFDGTTVWTRDPTGTREAPEAAAEAKSGLKRDVIALLVAAANGSVRARLLQDVHDAGRVEHALELTGGDLDPIILAVDSRTLLVTRETYTAGRGGSALVQELFSDYRAVDGVQMPFAAERRVGPLSVKRRVTDIQINTLLDPSLFKRSGS